MKHRLPADLNRKIGRAMHDYTMFDNGDRVLVAISGGIDSLVLCCILHIWQKKAPIQFELFPLHIDHGFWRLENDTPSYKAIRSQLQKIDASLEIEKEWELGEKERSCFLCARNRRSQLFDLARKKDCNKVALGHHKDDLVETFMMNAIYSGNISTMRPNQELFSGSLSIVRPMAYLEKKEVKLLGNLFEIVPVKNLCPLSYDTRREKVRGFLEQLYKEEPQAKSSIFTALGNVRSEYLL